MTLVNGKEQKEKGIGVILATIGAALAAIAALVAIIVFVTGKASLPELLGLQTTPTKQATATVPPPTEPVVIQNSPSIKIEQPIAGSIFRFDAKIPFKIKLAKGTSLAIWLFPPSQQCKWCTPYHIVVPIGMDGYAIGDIPLHQTPEIGTYRLYVELADPGLSEPAEVSVQVK